MAKTKKELTALEMLKAAYMEDINDKELQERYDGFGESLAIRKKRHNEIVPEINAALAKKQNLADAILTAALEGVISTEAIAVHKEVTKTIEQLAARIDKEKTEIDYFKNLIEKYKHNSEDRHFRWWKAFKAIDPEGTPAWADWKTTYADNII